jgi:methyl halide transferase
MFQTKPTIIFNLYMLSEFNYWEQRYQNKDTRWDLGQAAPPFVSLLTRTDAPRSGYTAVLGCGSGSDALLFAQSGFKVVGFDFAPSAIELANSRVASMNVEAEFVLGNIFDLPAKFWGNFDYVIEHTCFCAIPLEQRQDYVKIARSLLKSTGELIALFWAHSRPDGPPFGTNEWEIRTLFSPVFDVSRLETVTNSIDSRKDEELLGRFKVLQ